MSRTSEDRVDVPIDYRYLDALLRAAEDPEVSWIVRERGQAWSGSPNATVASTVCQEEKMAAPGPGGPTGMAGRERERELRNRKFGVKIMNDQAERGQVLRMSEEEARRRFPGLTVASHGAIKKEKPGGEVTTRILFDGTHGIDVNTRIRIRDQERAPIAADVKRALGEKAKQDEPTFALTADIAEAHRQVPIDARDWHYLGCQVTPGSDVYVHIVGTFGVA